LRLKLGVTQLPDLIRLSHDLDFGAF
jgi:hypothetical protein